MSRTIKLKLIFIHSLLFSLFKIQPQIAKTHTLLHTFFRITKKNIIFFISRMQRNWSNTVYLLRGFPDHKKIVLTKWIGDLTFNFRKGAQRCQSYYYTKLLSGNHSTGVHAESEGGVIFAYRCME